MFREFVRYYRPYRRILVIDLICAITVSLVDLAFPQILRMLQGGLFLEPAEQIVRTILWIGAGLLGLYVLKYFCQYYITSWGHIMGARMERDMRQDLFEQLQRLSFSYYDRNNTGDMMSRIVSDLFDISELAHHGPENYIISALKIAGSFILMLMINVPVTLILAAVTVAMLLFSLAQNRKMRAAFLDNQRRISDVNSGLKDSLSGIRVVKSFGNEDWEKRRFRKSNQAFLDSKTRSYRVMARFHAGNGFFQGILYTTILVAGGLYVGAGQMQVGELAIYALYVGIFVAPIEVLINFTEQFQKGYAGFRRFREIMELEPDITNSPGARPLGPVEGNVEYRHVSFAYPDDPDTLVLDDVQLSVPAGTKLALIGPSGGGKTTLCSLLPRFYDPTAGAVCIDGTNVRDVTIASLRSAIGIVQQDVYMFAGTIRDNIAYGDLGASEEQILKAARQARVDEFAEQFPDGYDTYVGEGGARLSGGQKQRIAIARVFLKNPRILILDEATSALDNESERHIQEALDRLAHGRTTFVIAHRLSTIRNADQIVVIDDNRIVETGSHAQLLQRGGLYAKYYEMQFGKDAA